MAQPTWYPTRHAVDKMKNRDISWAEVLEIIEHPEVKWIDGDSSVYQKGDLAVVVCNDGKIVTVLYRVQDEWTDEDVRNRKGESEKAEAVPLYAHAQCTRVGYHESHIYQFGFDIYECYGVPQIPYRVGRAKKPCGEQRAHLNHVYGPQDTPFYCDGFRSRRSRY